MLFVYYKMKNGCCITKFAKFAIEKGTRPSGTIVLVIFILSSLFVTTLFYHLDMVNASSDFDFEDLNNETFIENPTEFIENPTVDNPTANIIVSVYSNGASLADYYKAEPTDLNIPSGSWTIEQLHERFPAVIQKIDSNESNNEFFINKSVIIGKDAELTYQT